MHSQRRPAFTLIELLVVIAIIAVLVGLTVLGLTSWFGNIPKTTTNKELLMLSDSATAFKGDFDFYPPSKIVLRPSLGIQKLPSGVTPTPNQPKGYDLSIPLEKASHELLVKMFPTVAPTTSLDWLGTGVPLPDAVILEGDQCLVFFLGGLGGTDGFAKGVDAADPAPNPTKPKSKVPSRYGPYFQFKANRLFKRVAGNGFASYMDPWAEPSEVATAKPYAYFATRPGSTNRYDLSHAFLGAQPYWKKGATATAPKQFIRPDSFQIISAGQNRQFGPGGEWVASNPVVNDAGKDDQSNFHDNLVGIAGGS